MKKLTLSQWTSIAEIAGMMAVVVSLVFVGLEIRQNTNQVKKESLESGSEFINEVYGMFETTNDTDLVLRGLEDFDSLSRAEKVIFDKKLVHVTTKFEIVGELYNQGLIEDFMYDNYEEIMGRLLLSPGVITWYEITEYTFPTHIREKYALVKERHAGKETLFEYFKYERGGK